MQRFGSAAVALVRPFIVLLVVAALNPGCATASRAGDALNDDDRIVWASNNSKLEGLPISIETVSLALHNLGVLPTTEVDPLEFSGGSVEQFLSNKFPVYNWSQRIDNVLCDLNPAHCWRPRVEVSATAINDLLGHSSGFALTPASASKWKLIDRERIRVPDLSLRPRANWVDTEIPRGRDLQQIYETEGLGCLGAISPTTKYDLVGNLPELRRKLIALSGLDCPKYIAARQQVRWSVLSFEANKPKSIRGSSYDQHINNAYLTGQRALDWIYQTPDIEEAWKRLARASNAAYARVPQQERVTLPVASVATTVDNGHLASAYADYLSSKPSIASSPRWRAFYGPLQPRDRFEQLSRIIAVDHVRLSSLGEGKADAYVKRFDVNVNDFILERQRKSLFGPINYDLDAALAVAYPQSIIFMDDSFQKESCVFSSSTPCTPNWLDGTILAATSGSNRVIAEKLRAELNDLQDGRGHGTGVAAVAVAQPANGVMIGINPAALPIHYKFDLNRWDAGGFKEKVEKFLAQLRKPLTPTAGFLTWNLSGHTSTRAFAAPIENYLKRYKRERLLPESDFFVFAAGNEHSDTVVDHHGTGECLSYPACWSRLYKNVITVVGATLNAEGYPVLWRSAAGDSMTYTDPSFEIAAMAGGMVVPSQTVEGFYEVEGTSYAAPQVAAVVSMLRGGLISPPELVEARLVACGKMSTDLVGYVAGGLLDVQCSIGVRKTQVAFEPSAASETPASTARMLRPAELKAIWQKTGERASYLSESGSESNNRPRLWPELFKDSIIGYRKLVGKNEQRFKLVTLDSKLNTKTEIREQIKEPLFLEVQFEDDQETTCIPFRDLIAYVPAVPEVVGNEEEAIPASKSSCHFGIAGQ